MSEKRLEFDVFVRADAENEVALPDDLNMGITVTAIPEWLGWPFWRRPAVPPQPTPTTPVRKQPNPPEPGTLDVRLEEYLTSRGLSGLEGASIYPLDAIVATEPAQLVRQMQPGRTLIIDADISTPLTFTALRPLAENQEVLREVDRVVVIDRGLLRD